MKLKLKIYDKNANKLIDEESIQSIEFSRGKSRLFYTDDEGYTKFTDNFEIIIELLPPEPIKVKDITIKKALKEAKILGEKRKVMKNE